MLIMDFLAAKFLASVGLEQKPLIGLEQPQRNVFSSSSMQVYFLCEHYGQHSLRNKDHWDRDPVRWRTVFDFNWRYDKRSSDLSNTTQFLSRLRATSQCYLQWHSFSGLYKSSPSSNFVCWRIARNLELLASTFRAVIFRLLSRARCKSWKEKLLTACDARLRIASPVLFAKFPKWSTYLNPRSLHITTLQLST